MPKRVRDHGRQTQQPKGHGGQGAGEEEPAGGGGIGVGPGLGGAVALDAAPGRPYPAADGEEHPQQHEGADAVELLVDDATLAGAAGRAGVGGDGDAACVKEVGGAENNLLVAVFVAAGEHGVAARRTLDGGPGTV